MNTKNVRYLNLLLISLMLMSIQVSAQFTKLWDVDLPQNDIDYIRGDKIQFDDENTCYSLTRYISDGQQFQTTRFDGDGNVLWSNNEASDGENLSPIEMILQNGAYVIGNNNNNPTYWYVVKYNEQGNTEFSDNQNNNGLFRMAKDPSGNIVITGIVDPGPNDPDHMLLTKYSPSGDILWQIDHSPGDLDTHFDNTFCIAADNAGNFYITAGHVNNNLNPSVRTLRLIKVDANGNVIWDIAVDSSGDHLYYPTDLKFNPIDNSVYAVYELNSYIVTSLDKISKVTASGVVGWTKSYTGNQAGGDNRLRIGADGQVYWWQNGANLGAYYGFSFVSGSAYAGNIFRYDSGGNETGYYWGSAFTVDDDGNAYVIYTQVNLGIPKVHIAKYDPHGVLLWDEADNTSYSYVYLDIYHDQNGHLYAMAGLPGTNTTIIKYDLSCNYTKAPAKPSAINGPVTNVCASNAYSYSCPSINKATYYYWSIPAGAAIINGQGTNNVSIGFPEGFASGKISVYGSNCFAAGKSLSITVYGIPAKPGAITGATTVCANQQNVVYSINPVAGANAYNWKVPEGANIISGQGSAQITVSYGNSGGKVKVKSKSDCGNSDYKMLKVNMNCRFNEASFYTEVFPNPSASHFSVNTNQSFETFRLFDLAGKMLLTKPFINGMQFGATLPAGSYFVELSGAEGKKILQVVKSEER